MKKYKIAGIVIVGALGLGACGKQELQLVSETVETELGTALDETVTAYAALDEKKASEAALDLSGVNIMKAGAYTATVTYREQSASFEVVVKDTIAPEVVAEETVTVPAGEPLFVSDVVTGINELSGEVTAEFQEPEAGTAELESETETLGEAGMEEAEPGTEETGMGTGEAETFLLGDVVCENASIVYPEAGEYDNLLTIADVSGNRAEVLVHVIAGTVPELSGVEDLTLTVGEKEVDYLAGVTASDFNGNDLTGQIQCDAGNVDLSTAGEYEITYTVTDANGFQVEKKAKVTVKEAGGKTSSKTEAGTKKDKETAGKGSKGTNTVDTGKASKSTGSTVNEKTEAASGSTGSNGGGQAAGTPDSGSNGNSGSNGSSGNSGSQSTPTTPDTGSSGTGSGSQSAPSTPDAGNSGTGSGSQSAPSTPDNSTTGNADPSANDTNAGSDNVSEGNPPENWWESDEWADVPVFDPSTNPPREDELGGGAIEIH